MPVLVNWSWQSGRAREETYLSSAVSKHVVADYVRRFSSEESSALKHLAAHQQEVLQLIAEGQTTKEIADLLYVNNARVEM